MNLREFREEELAKNKRSDITVQGYYHAFNRKSSQNKNGRKQRIAKMNKLIDSGVNSVTELQDSLGIAFFTLRSYVSECHYSISKGKVIRK